MDEKMEKNIKSHKTKKRMLILATGAALALAAFGVVATNRPASETDSPKAEETQREDAAVVRATPENSDAQATLATGEQEPTSDFEQTLAKIEELRPYSVKLIQTTTATTDQKKIALEFAILLYAARENIDYVSANVRSIKVVPFANVEDENASVKYFVRVEFANGKVRYYDEEKVDGYERAELSTLAVAGELSEEEMPEIATRNREELYERFGVKVAAP